MPVLELQEALDAANEKITAALREQMAQQAQMGAMAPAADLSFIPDMPKWPQGANYEELGKRRQFQIMALYKRSVAAMVCLMRVCVMCSTCFE